jgi:nucleotide-binding universal stress UspA family protein
MRRILAPTDFSSPSKHAVAHARHLASGTRATLELFHALPNVEVPLPMNPGLGGATAIVAELEPEARRALKKMAKVDGPSVPIETEVWQGPPAGTILNRAEASEADLIVIASHGHSALDRLLLGSVTEKVARRASCPVMVVPAHGWSLLP